MALLPVDRLPWLSVRVAAMVALCAVCWGCAGMRVKQHLTESVAECRRYSRQGVSAMETGDWGQAEQLLRRAVNASPTDADARWRLAETLWTRNERTEAIQHMKSVVEHEANNAEAAVRYGEMLLAVDQHSEAIEHAQRALSLNPRLANAWALRGRCLQRQGDTSRALADLHHALREEPEMRDVLVDIALIYRQSDRRRRELTTLHMLRDTYLPGEEPEDLLIGEADAYLALGRPKAAVERLRLACNRAPASAPLLCRLAEAEAAAGEPQQAIATAQLAINVDGGHQPARDLLARLGGTQVR